MRVFQRLADLRDDGQCFTGREATRIYQASKIHAIDVFHQKVKEAIFPPKLVQGHNVAMVEPSQRLRFPRKPIGKGPIMIDGRRKDLERHDPIQRKLARLVNGPHSSTTEQFQYFKFREKGRHFGEGGRVDEFLLSVPHARSILVITGGSLGGVR